MGRRQLPARCILVLLMGVLPHALVHAQSVTSVVVPRYMQGQVGTNLNRVPYACRLRLNGLLAASTYRYFNQMVTSADPVTANGSGNAIYATPTGDFKRSTSVSLSSLGNYGTFTTDATGAYQGWFITEPTANDRFTPGKFVFMRIALNDGGSGTTVATRITTGDSIRVVKLSAGATDSTGTGLRGSSFAKQSDFVFTYDNTAGSGRPISGSFIESDGTNNSTSNSYAAFYGDIVDGVRGAYGTVLPNLLPTGVRRVERRSLLTGAVVVAATDTDGLWPGGAQTVNPNGGTTPLVLKSSDVNHLATGLALDPSSKSYGNVAVGVSKFDSVLAKNVTGGSLTINTIVSNDTSAFAVSSSAGPITLAAGATTWVRIVFHPRIVGEREGRLTFTNTGNTSPDTLHLDGVGVAVATSVVFPRFIEGVFDSNTNRVPFACRLRLTKLVASKTYRYYNQVVMSSDGPQDQGSGNPIYPLATGFVRTQKVDFDSTNHYGTLTTDATGTYEGWFITEPTAGSRFLPGKFVFMRINLNDGNNGTSVMTRATTTDSVRVVKLSAGALDSTGTGLRGTSFAKEKDFVFTYDNTAGTGRPLSGTFIENDGTDGDTLNFYSPFYATYVEQVRGAFGMLLPNKLSTGMRRVERRSLTSGAIVTSATDNDGTWPGGAATVNPNGGTNAIALKGSDVNYLATGLAIDPSFKSFGYVNVSTTKTDSVLIKNTTGSSMTVSSIVSSDTSAFAVTSSAGPFSLSGGATAWVRFVFHPRSPGPKSARLTFTNSGNTSPDTLHLDGRGLAVATPLYFPRFMEGIFGTNSDRVPFACRLRLSRLLPNKTYRYYNQVVTSADQPTDDGAGNPIFPTASGPFLRTQTVGFDAIPHYSTFTTDGSGNYDGWFITEPTGGGRFLPGKFVFVRISLNDGGTGTNVFTRITTTDSIRIVKLSSGATDSTGTGLRGSTIAGQKDFIFAWSDTGGTGRPICGTFVENDGSDNSAANSYTAFYATNVNGKPGAFGMVLPNLLPTGIRRIERRSIGNGALAAYVKDTDGQWPSGAQTVNPNGGKTAIALSAADVGYLVVGAEDVPVPRVFMLAQNGPNPAHLTTSIRFSVAEDGVATLVVYDVLGRVAAIPFNGPATPGKEYVVTVDGNRLRSGVYWYRLRSGDRTATRKMVLLR